MKKLLLPVIATLLSTTFFLSTARSQDILYTQFLNAPLYYNPALTGAEQGFRTSTVARLQQSGTPVHYNSFNFSGDWGNRKIPFLGGIGLIVNAGNEGLGFISNLQIGISASARIKFSENVAAQIGVKASLLMKKVNWDDFVYSDQLSEIYGNVYYSSFSRPVENNKTIPDFGAGAMVQFANTRKTFSGTAGFAADHITSPNISFNPDEALSLSPKIIVHTDFMISTREQSSAQLLHPGFHDPLKINPAILFQNQNKISSIQAGLNLIKFNFILGFWFRTASDVRYINNYTTESLQFGYRVFFKQKSTLCLKYSLDLSGKKVGKTPIYANELSLTFAMGR